MPKRSSHLTSPPRDTSRPPTTLDNDELCELGELKRRALLESNKISEILTALNPPKRKDGSVHRSN